MSWFCHETFRVMSRQWTNGVRDSCVEEQRNGMRREFRRIFILDTDLAAIIP